MKKFYIFIFLFHFCTLSLFSQSPLGRVLFLNSQGQQVWDFLPPQSLQNAGWALIGNDLTSNPNWFLGTTSNHPLNIFTNNQIRLIILNSGNVGSFGLFSNNGTNYVGFAAPTGLTSNLIFTLPAVDGTSGQVLATDGNGNLYWTSSIVGSVPFSQIATGTNNTANMTVGSGATLTISGTGVIEANRFIAGGTSNAVDLNSSEVSGTLPIANGGTGATTANAALNNLLPSQTGNAGRFLQTDGTNTSWQPESDPQVGNFTANGQVARWNATNLEPGIITDWSDNVNIYNGNPNNITIGNDATNDQFNVVAASTFTGNVTIAGNVLPSGANRTLGSSTAYWDEIYVDDNSVNFVDGANLGALTTALTGARTWTLPDATGTVITTGNLTDITAVGTLTGTIEFEGSTVDVNETTLGVIDPTADRTINLPDASGTVALLENAQTWTAAQTFNNGITTTTLNASGNVSVQGASYPDVTIGNSSNFNNPTGNSDLYVAGNLEVDNTVVSSRLIGPTASASSGVGGYSIIYYPSLGKTFFDIWDNGSSYALVTIGPADATATAINAGVRINDRANGQMRAGIGWNTSTNSWSAGVGDLGTSLTGDEYGVYLNYATNTTSNEARIAVANGNILNPVFLVDREGDLTAASVTTGGLTIDNQTATGISFQIQDNGGAMRLSVANYNADATLNDDNVIHIITGGTTFSFPSNQSGKVIIVVNTTGSSITVGSVTVNSNTAAMFVGNGTNWYRVQ